MKQKLAGIAMLIVTVVILIVAGGEDGGATGAILTFISGIALLRGWE